MIIVNDTDSTLDQITYRLYTTSTAKWITPPPVEVDLFKRTNRRPVVAQKQSKQREQLKTWGLRK